MSDNGDDFDWGFVGDLIGTIAEESPWLALVLLLVAVSIFGWQQCSAEARVEVQSGAGGGVVEGKW